MTALPSPTNRPNAVLDDGRNTALVAALLFVFGLVYDACWLE